ncbi:hypothetical protein [Puniceibacterium sp. IMCC21224]|uniref:hypothetical protein n=1 Tax=Puniceibacterium sp. IMCC21224 TaxID=1618204 RepID=UPI00064DF6AC|nr:hypothetical protein [Puniceibacterium sp. IMCC21224]KMK64692.1 hypothetical protein IMCC21224_13227 [Puniceibacterium sp. IMCC21224]
MTDRSHRPSLHKILALDAATCVAMGILLVCASGLIAGLTQIPGPFLLWAGVILLPVAGFMAACARLKAIPSWAVQAIVSGNIFWVVGSMILPMAGLINPNALGWVFLIMQSSVVAMFAALEWVARRDPNPSA